MKMKRFWALLLVFCMVFGTLAGEALAAKGGDAAVFSQASEEASVSMDEAGVSEEKVFTEGEVPDEGSLEPEFSNKETETPGLKEAVSGEKAESQNLVEAASGEKTEMPGSGEAVSTEETELPGQEETVSAEDKKVEEASEVTPADLEEAE